VAAHGIVDFLTESMMERGDKYYMAVCNKTGLLAVYNPAKNLFFSPMADGPIKYIGSLDGKEMHIENITKYGREFSVVCIPYSLKLLIQELQAANIQMRIITEDNLPQLEGMSFSKNIDHLMGLDVSVLDNMGVENLSKKMNKLIREAKLIDLDAPVTTTTTTPESSPFQILSEGVIEKLPEVETEAESPGYELPDTPPEIRAELEAREAAAKAETKGGGESTEKYEINDLVFYRGDPTKSWWQIIDKTSKYLTIQKVIVDDRVIPPIFIESSPDGGIEVVHPRELYTWNDIPNATAPMTTGYKLDMINGYENINELPYMINPDSVQYQQPTPNINFQPVINVMGGDNKGTIEAPASNSIPVTEPIMNIPKVVSMVGGQEEKNTNAHMENKQENENQPSNKINFGGGLVIKKMG
jgi:hypothetical protein